MWRKVIKLSANPRALLRSVLALDDSPHAIALGVAIGIFVGLTPTVGIQTVLILALVILCRPFFYFNGSAAMAATYVSNPFTMVPLYYFWYRLGARFFSSNVSFEDFKAALQFDGLVGWWETVSTLGVQVGMPTLIGGLLTAPFGVALAYPAAYYLVKWSRSPARPQHRSNAHHSDQDDGPAAGGGPAADGAIADNASAVQTEASDSNEPPSDRNEPVSDPKHRRTLAIASEDAQSFTVS